MNLKKIIKPQISKIIIFLILILIFGVPATSRSCSHFPLGPDETPPPCVEKFTFSNLILDFSGAMRYPHVMDASTSFSYNPLIVAGYLIFLYLILSFLFHVSNYNWKRVVLYLSIVCVLFFIFLFLYSINKSKAHIESIILKNDSCRINEDC